MMTSLHYEASLSDYIITFLTFLDFLENEVYKVPKVINFTKDCKTAERYAKIMHCACCSNAVMVFRNLKRCCTVSSSVQHITWNISWRYWQTDNSEILYIWWFQEDFGAIPGYKYGTLYENAWKHNWRNWRRNSCRSSWKNP